MFLYTSIFFFFKFYFFLKTFAANDNVSQRSGLAPEEKASSGSVCRSSSALGYKTLPEPAAIATAIKERIRAFFMEVGKLPVNKRKDETQSKKQKEDKYK